jgi:hypothetical protein
VPPIFGLAKENPIGIVHGHPAAAPDTESKKPPQNSTRAATRLTTANSVAT